MVASVLLKGMNPGNGTPFGAVRLPSTGSELRASAGDSFMLNDRWDSDTQASDRAMEEFYDPWYDRMEAANSGFDRTSIYNQSARWFNEPSPSLGNRIAYNKLEAKHAYMADQAEKMGEAFPDFEGLYNQAGKRGLEIASTAYEKFLMDMQYTQSTSPRLQAAAGSVGPAITDPLVLGSIAVTLPLGISVIAARTIAMEAGIAALTEIPIQAQRSDWYRKQGRELTTDEMVLNIVLAAGTAGLIGGGVSKIYKWAGGTSG